MLAFISGDSYTTVITLSQCLTCILVLLDELIVDLTVFLVNIFKTSVCTICRNGISTSRGVVKVDSRVSFI